MCALHDLLPGPFKDRYFTSSLNAVDALLIAIAKTKMLSNRADIFGEPYEKRTLFFSGTHFLDIDRHLPAFVYRLSTVSPSSGK